MTETNMNTSNPYDGDRRAGTVGLPLPGVELRIMGEAGPMPEGEVGVIEVRGPNVFQGYWQMPEKTREELLLRTDDLAFNVEDNFRKVSVARAVNQRVMQAIADVVNEQHRPGTYGRNGQTTSTQDLALSVNLNQRA
jgi:acyl-CoA synthetase (AMP-forming)/AMP-acid ligase II